MQPIAKLLEGKFSDDNFSGRFFMKFQTQYTEEIQRLNNVRFTEGNTSETIQFERNTSQSKIKQN